MFQWKSPFFIKEKQRVDQKNLVKFLKMQNLNFSEIEKKQTNLSFWVYSKLYIVWSLI